jgi:two-component system, NarL family, nitrate/nitrite response regulator NarL
MSTTRIVIATTDLECRISLLAVLRSEPEFTVVGEASNEEGFLALRGRLRPDILLLDSALAGLVNDVGDSWPAARIILLAATIDEAHVIQALRLPARAIVPKNAPPQVLLRSIRSVLADQYWLGADSVAILVHMLRDLLLERRVEFPYERHGLTLREENIVARIANGYSNKQIAQDLAISERTVKHHLTSVFGKLGLSSRLQVANFAVTHRLPVNGGRASFGPRTSADSDGRGPRKPLSAVSSMG